MPRNSSAVCRVATTPWLASVARRYRVVKRQRIAIARAVIRNSPILILDEPTAALDTESEHLVIEALRRLMKGRTVIMIAHRLSTLVDADKIIVLKDGIVAEEGTHEVLIARGGVFSELHRIQYQATRRFADAA